jgi:hypothetical protein
MAYDRLLPPYGVDSRHFRGKAVKVADGTLPSA